MIPLIAEIRFLSKFKISFCSSEHKMSDLPVLGYWDLRGKGETIRYLLKIAGVPFVDNRYLIDNRGKKWFDEKFSLGLDFPNLPYWIEGDFKLTQSLAILRHLARKHGLVSKNEQTLARQELIEQQLLDVIKAFFTLIGQEFEDKKQEYLDKTLSPQLEQLAKFLGTNDWFTKELSYADILAYETLDWLKMFSPETFEKFPTLNQFIDRFANLEPIKEHINSPQYKKFPIVGPWAKWGGISFN